MKKEVGLIGAIVLIILGGAGYFFIGGGDSGLRVASFNGEVFGDAKISNVGVDYYVDLISDYDLFFLLEIRDADNSSFEELCSELDGYDCYLSGRSGRTISKEAVGVFARSDLGVLKLEEYNDSEDYFERVPVHIVVDGVMYWAVHLSLDDVYRELEALEVLVSSEEFVVSSGTVVLGDMNADCDYYSSGVDFDSWDWVIGDDADTASGFKNCAYDRVITKNVEVLDSGVREIDVRVSDHNLVWVEIGAGE